MDQTKEWQGQRMEIVFRVTRRKLSCGTLPLEQLEALKTDTMGLMATILAEPQSDPAQLTKARTL